MGSIGRAGGAPLAVQMLARARSPDRVTVHPVQAGAIAYGGGGTAHPFVQSAAQMPVSEMQSVPAGQLAQVLSGAHWLTSMSTQNCPSGALIQVPFALPGQGVGSPAVQKFISAVHP